MALQVWDPFAALARADREFDELVRRTWSGPGRRTSGLSPAVEIRRDGDDVVVTAELPGVDVDKDVNIELDGRNLVISGERRDTRENDDDRVYVRELRYGSFRRTFRLPENVNAEDIQATYENGLLTVRVQGAGTSTKGGQKIAIQPVEKTAQIEPGDDAA